MGLTVSHLVLQTVPLNDGEDLNSTDERGSVAEHRLNVNMSCWYIQFLSVWQWQGDDRQQVFSWSAVRREDCPQEGGVGRVSRPIGSGELSGPISINAEGELQRMMGQRTDLTCDQQRVRFLKISSGRGETSRVVIPSYKFLWFWPTGQWLKHAEQSSSENFNPSSLSQWDHIKSVLFPLSLC